jgi:hypothetical protein
MKRLLFIPLALLALPLIVTAQNTKVKTKTKDAEGKVTKMKEKGNMDMKGNMMDFPYQAEYSSKFQLGDPAHAKLILDMWKDWDDNPLDRHADAIADTIVMQTPSGELIKGKDAFLSTGKQMRSMISSTKSGIEVWLPLKSIDRNENWVAIWGHEDDTDKDGKVTSQMLHEIWRINKDGKIDFFRQYTAKPVMQQQ